MSENSWKSSVRLKSFKVADLMSFAIHYYIQEGKGSVHIGVGCTGGRHRSVYCAEKVAEKLEACGIKCIMTHRDIDKEPHRYTKKADEN